MKMGNRILKNLHLSLLKTIAIVGLITFGVNCGDDTASNVHTTECIDDVSATDNREFSCNGITFDISVPAECIEGGCPLIFDVHGWTMSATSEDTNTNLAEIGRENGYIVVQPNANLVEEVPSWSRDDYPAIFEFMKQTIEVFDVDEDRVHFTGFSQGGAMTWHFICEHSDVIASAAPISAGGAECFGEGKSNPDVPILYCHGTDDTLVAFETAEATVARITEGLGNSVPPEVLSFDSNYTWTRYTNDSGQLFEFIEHDYTGLVGGHCFPGTYEEPGGLYGCSDPAAFRWGDEVMDFFIAHPKN